MIADGYTTNQDLIILLSQRLKEYRLAARISQREMAERSGVSLSTISHLEQGINRNITLNNFISLLRAIGMEQRLTDLLPELPMPPMALKQINKYIPKRVRRRGGIIEPFDHRFLIEDDGMWHGKIGYRKENVKGD